MPRPNRLVVALSASLVAVAACGGGDGPSSLDAGAPPLLTAPPDGEGQQLGMDVTVAAGDEIEQCQYVVIDQAIEIVRFEHAYSAGSHHLLLYQTGLLAGDAPTELFDCTGAQLTDLGVSGIAYAAQVPDGELAYPDDVALKVGAGTVLLVQTHYLNAGTADLDAEVRLNLWFGAEPAPIEAGTLFFYDWAIVVPQDEAATARMRCQVPTDVNLIFGMSHMHRRGVDYQATLDTGAGEPTLLFETDLWEGVEPRRYQPLQPVAGGSVIDFHCNYQGDPDRTIIEGPSAEDNEMCMFIASYYPRLDPMVELCATAGSGPVFEGDQTCSQTVTCVRNATDPVAAEQCLLDTCEASNQVATDLMTCMFYQCGDACAEPGATCDSCILSTCASQFGACSDATCG